MLGVRSVFQEREEVRQMFTGYGFNDYGTLVSEHRCDECGLPFTICPAKDGPEGDAFWGGCCLAEECESYDESRDIDKVWDAVQGVIHREEIERS